MTTESFLAFAEGLPEAMLLIDANGVILAANQATRTRLSIHTAPGTSLSELVAESTTDVEQYLRSCSRSRQIVLGKMSFKQPDRAPLACRSEGKLIRPVSADSPAILLLRLGPKDASIPQFLLLNERISELGKEIQRRKETEEALRTQKDWLQVTLSSIGDAVIATDAVGNVVFMNPVAEAFTGWTEKEAAGKPLTDVFRIINETTREHVENPVDIVIRTGAVAGLANHTVVIGRDGVERPIEDSAAPIRNASGKVLGVILVFHDVTAQRRAARELRESDRRKDEFLAILAHELRNPLAPIRNSLELMKLAEDDAEIVRQSRETMERQLTHMVRLIEDLLDVSRISRGKLELRRTLVELQSVVHQALEHVVPLLSECDHDIDVDFPREPVVLEADPVRLVQVFSNLLNNACKFTPPGGRIELAAELRGSVVTVRLKDSGIGMPPDKLETVFEMFSQVDHSLERSHGGLGIGLTLVRKLVEMHGGSVVAHSEGPGHGSEFTVTLPVADTSPLPVAGGISKVLAFRCRRILVVDDQRDVASTMALLLRALGHETQLAFSGREAIELANRFLPELIFLDLGMPQMSGYDTARELRINPRLADTVLVALTGWGQEEDRRRTREAGFDRHLVKPASGAAIRELLDSVDKRP
jgi:PAS domain S-box-containing protein